MTKQHWGACYLLTYHIEITIYACYLATFATLKFWNIQLTLPNSTLSTYFYYYIYKANKAMFNIVKNEFVLNWFSFYMLYKLFHCTKSFVHKELISVLQWSQRLMTGEEEHARLGITYKRVSVWRHCSQFIQACYYRSFCICPFCPAKKIWFWPV